MSKSKKQVRTAEDGLEQTLVFVAEHPHTSPDNWIWARFENVLDYEQPTNYIVESTDYNDEYTTPVLTAGKSFIRGYTNETSGIFQKYPVVIFDDFTTATKYVDFSFKVKSSAMKILHATTEVGIKFIYYYMQTVDCDSANHKRFWISTYSKLPFPIPPLLEQQRIINRIESLFEKLDRAKILVQSALDSFETRKAAILHKAFTGELTAKWREVHGASLNDWADKPIKEITKMRSGYAFDSKQFVDSGYQVLRMGNLYGGVLDTERNPVFMNKDSVDDIIREKFTAKKGDILLTLTGTKYKRDYGYAVLIERNDGHLVNQRILSLTPINVEQNFILYYLCSDMFRNVFFSKETGGVNQGNVSSTFVGNILVSLPSEDEQKEIARILDDIFAKESAAKELTDTIEKIDHMKKAILARAFRGELGTNDPTEESALVLLEEMLSARRSK